MEGSICCKDANSLFCMCLERGRFYPQEDLYQKLVEPAQPLILTDIESSLLNHSTSAEYVSWSL
jgi:hypothetical protein